MAPTVISGKIVPHCSRNDKGQGKRNHIYMYFVHITQRDTHVEWFKLDMSSGEFSPAFELTMKDIAFTNSGIVTLGSVIYVIGGVGHNVIFLDPFKPNRPHDVYYFDTAHPKHGWRRAASLLAPRAIPYCFVFYGKIYVFGGAIFGGPYAEVYDPLKNSWEALPDPSRDLGFSLQIHPFHAILADSDSHSNPRVVLQSCSTDALHAYHFGDGTWSVVDDAKLGEVHSEAIIVDDVLFSFSSDREWMSMRAYSLQANKWLPSSFKELVRPIIRYPHSIKLVDLGKGNILLAWSNVDESHEKFVECMKVRVEVVRAGQVPISVYAIKESRTALPVKQSIFLKNMVCLSA